MSQKSSISLEYEQLKNQLLADMMAIPAFFPALLRLVSRGEPVPIAALATEVHIPIHDIEQWLRQQPGTDWDSQGRLLGFLLTQRPTNHRFVLDGRTLYTFCAADALIFPALLGQTANVESRCADSGQQVHVKVEPNAVVFADPGQTMVSHIPGSLSSCDIRSTVCNHGVFYASVESALHWQERHPNGVVLPVEEFFNICLAGLKKAGLIHLRESL